jgi:hypothetical protein
MTMKERRYKKIKQSGFDWSDFTGGVGRVLRM